MTIKLIDQSYLLVYKKTGSLIAVYFKRHKKLNKTKLDHLWSLKIV
jgi:hypothetical protein